MRAAAQARRGWRRARRARWARRRAREGACRGGSPREGAARWQRPGVPRARQGARGPRWGGRRARRRLAAPPGRRTAPSPRARRAACPIWLPRPRLLRRLQLPMPEARAARAAREACAACAARGAARWRARGEARGPPDRQAAAAASPHAPPAISTRSRSRPTRAAGCHDPRRPVAFVSALQPAALRAAARTGWWAGVADVAPSPFQAAVAERCTRAVAVAKLSTRLTLSGCSRKASCAAPRASTWRSAAPVLQPLGPSFRHKRHIGSAYGSPASVGCPCAETLPEVRRPRHGPAREQPSSVRRVEMAKVGGEKQRTYAIIK